MGIGVGGGSEGGGGKLGGCVGEGEDDGIFTFDTSTHSSSVHALQ